MSEAVVTSSLSSVLLRDVDLAAAIRGLDQYCGRRGYGRVPVSSPSGAHVLRASVQTCGRWTACALEDVHEPESLARPLSKAIGCLALVSTQESGPQTLVRPRPRSTESARVPLIRGVSSREDFVDGRGRDGAGEPDV